MGGGGAFPLTLRDMFTNTHTVEVNPQTKVFQVKELLRAAKHAEAQAALAEARPAVARLEMESEMAREQEAKDQVAALEAKRVAAADEIARLEAQAREAGSVEYIDAMALLYNRQPLDDDTTVGSHGLTESTTVTLSMAQDPERGRAMRGERAERARREVEAAEAEQRDAPRRRAQRWALLMAVGAAVQQAGWWSLYRELGVGLGLLGGAVMLVGALGFDCGAGAALVRCWWGADAGHSLHWNCCCRGRYTAEERRKENERRRAYQALVGLRVAAGEGELPVSARKGCARFGLWFVLLVVYGGLATRATWCSADCSALGADVRGVPQLITASGGAGGCAWVNDRWARTDDSMDGHGHPQWARLGNQGDKIRWQDGMWRVRGRDTGLAECREIPGQPPAYKGLCEEYHNRTACVHYLRVDHCEWISQADAFVVTSHAYIPPKHGWQGTGCPGSLQLAYDAPLTDGSWGSRQHHGYDDCAGAAAGAALSLAALILLLCPAIARELAAMRRESVALEQL